MLYMFSVKGDNLMLNKTKERKTKLLYTALMLSSSQLKKQKTTTKKNHFLYKKYKNKKMVI